MKENYTTPSVEVIVFTETEPICTMSQVFGTEVFIYLDEGEW